MCFTESFPILFHDLCDGTAPNYSPTKKTGDRKRAQAGEGQVPGEGGNGRRAHPHSMPAVPAAKARPSRPGRVQLNCKLFLFISSYAV